MFQPLSRRFPALILLPFLTYVTVDFVLRVSHAIFATTLVAEFSLGPAELGLVSSAFFVAFALTQLPMGLALDRFGPRPTVIVLLVVAVIRGAIYIATESVLGLALGRFLIGFGMAGSLMGGIKAGSLWFPSDRLPQVTAAHVTLAGVGGMLATGPMAALLGYVGWRDVLAGLMAICLVVILLLATLVPAQPRTAETGLSLVRQLREFASIFLSLRFWRFAPVAMAGVGSGVSYQTLWTPLWLRDVAGFGAMAQAWSLFAVFAGLAVGNFAFGWLFRRLAAKGMAIMPFAISGFAFSIVLQAFLVLSAGALAPAVLWVAISLFFACLFAVYSVVAQQFAPALAGRTASSVNAMVFVGAFVTQWVTGLIIDAYPIRPDGGYAVDGHLASLWVVIALHVLALAWYGGAGMIARR